jgi:hypothetical protein
MRALKRSAAALAVAIAITSVGATGAEAAARPVHCYKEATNYYMTFTTNCYQVVSTKLSTFKVLWSHAMINNLPWASDYTCTVDKGTSFGASATITLGAKVGNAIVGEMNASVAAQVTGSVTSSYGSHTSTKVPARRTVYSDHGTFTYRGTVTKKPLGWRIPMRVQTFTETAPTIMAWRLRV